MKKITVLVLIGALATLASNRLNAGDKEWSVVGKILTGVAAAAIVGDAISHQHHHHRTYRSRSHRANPFIPKHVTVIQAPAPVFVPAQPRVIVRHRPHSARQRTVILQPAPIVVRSSRPRYRARPYRQARYVIQNTASCRAPY